MRTACEVPTPLLCRNSMISRITFCSAQRATIALRVAAAVILTQVAD
jgi:hypothetical protein